MPTPVSSNIDCQAVVDEFGLMGCGRYIGPGAQRDAGFIKEQLQLAEGNCNVIPLCQRLISVLISEECGVEGDDPKFDAYDTEFEIDRELKLDNLDHHSQANYHITSHSASNGYKITRKPEHDDTESDVVDISPIGLNPSQNMLMSTCSESEYDALDINGKLLLELQSIGISPEPVVSYFSLFAMFPLNLISGEM